MKIDSDNVAGITSSMMVIGGSFGLWQNSFWAGFCAAFVVLLVVQLK